MKNRDSMDLRVLDLIEQVTAEIYDDELKITIGVLCQARYKERLVGVVLSTNDMLTAMYATEEFSRLLELERISAN